MVQTRPPVLGAWLLAIGAWVLGGCARVEQVRPVDPGEIVADQGIVAAVERELETDLAIPEDRVHVGSQDGIVTLTGAVPDLLAKDHAAKLAETVLGVRAVVNRIEVQPRLPLPDRELKQRVKGALLFDPATDSYEVDVSVEDRVATLHGSVESFAEKQLAEKVAKGVSGLTGVANEIVVAPAPQRPDGEIRTDVEGRLRWDVLVDAGLIDVQVEQGRVMLAGSVGSASEWQRAVADSWVSGVKDVDASALSVDPWARENRQRDEAHVEVSEAGLRRAIETALRYDPRTSMFDVRVEVEGDVVTLLGVVDNLRAKRAAAQDARLTTGVASVRNLLVVEGEERPISDLGRRIRDAIQAHPYLNRFEGIDVQVQDGSVTLTGSVDSFYDKATADEIAAAVAGVGRVDNQLLVRDTKQVLTYDPRVAPFFPGEYEWYDYTPDVAYRSDGAIRASIKDQFFWSPFIDPTDVGVRVESGVATLTGNVGSMMEMHAAVQNAYQGGATWVNNELSIMD